jgi:hypothetical protein
MILAALHSEWLKQRRGATWWLAVASAGFVPAIVLAARLTHPGSLPALYAQPGFWEASWKVSWEAVAVLLLPMLLMLITSLVVQIETRNNTWKQVHAGPLPLAIVFGAKLAIIVVTVAGFFVLANLFACTGALIPSLLRDVPHPPPLPWRLFARRSAGLFVDGLPIVALQYTLSLQLKNLMVPLGVGMGLWLASIGALSWKYIYVIPYGYSAMDFLSIIGNRSLQDLPLGLHALSLLVAAAITAAGLLLYTRKPDLG